MTDYAEANISTEQSSSSQDPWLSCPYGYEEWPVGAQASPREGPQAFNTVALLKRLPRRALSKQTHLRNSAEFRRVYAGGMRFQGRLITAFALPNGLEHHRFGITASRKAVGNAVERNRAKRLLRETFRLSSGALEALETKYDWVLNAKQSLLSVKVQSSLEDFQMIVGQMAAREMRAALEARK
jgi:ribonuclease P protein component